MIDQDPSIDTLKLIRYRVFFVKRDLECVLHEGDDLTPEDLTRVDYTAWKLAEFVQNLNDMDVPTKWMAKNYPRRYPERTISAKIGYLPEDDMKYLRLGFKILAYYPREEFCVKARKVEALEQIRDVMLVLREENISAPKSSLVEMSATAAVRRFIMHIDQQNDIIHALTEVQIGRAALLDKLIRLLIRLKR